MSKLTRLLDAARNTDRGPQPLQADFVLRLAVSYWAHTVYSKEALVSLVPEIKLDSLSMLQHSQPEEVDQSKTAKDDSP